MDPYYTDESVTPRRVCASETKGAANPPTTARALPRRGAEPTMSDEQSNHTRGFRIVLAEGEVIYGAQFPSGRCVLDDTHRGLLEAAVSFNALAVLTIASATVEWNTVESEVDRLKGDVHAEKADLISARTEVELLRLENKALRLACGLPADLPYDEWPEHSAILPREEKGRP